MRCTAILIGCLTLASCKQIFSLEDTKPVDAFVTPPDVPWMCPSGVPSFGTEEHHFVTDNCRSYTVSEDLAMARCITGNAVYEGPINGELMATNLVDNASEEFGAPRLLPEGDRAIVNRCKPASACTLSLFRRSSPGAWTKEADLNIPVPADANFTTSSPTRGPIRHMIVPDANRDLHEYVGDGANWSALPTLYDGVQLGTGRISGFPRLSSDGLRMTFLAEMTQDAGDFKWLYVTRASIDDTFTGAKPLAGFSLLEEELVLQDNCGRAYYSASGRLGLFYKQQP